MSELSFMEKLLDGTVVKWKPLQDIANLKNGKDWKKLGTGDVPVYGSGGVMGYVDTYSYDKPTVLIPRKGSITNIFYTESPIWNVDTIYYTEIDETQIIPKFLYYFIKTIDLMKLDTGSGRPSLTQAILNKIQVPVPQQLEVQAEIVRILDAFTALTTELTTELNGRQKQYTHYRDQLLTFTEHDVEWKSLDDIVSFRRGSFPQPYGNSEWYDGEDSMPFVQVADVSDFGFSLNSNTNRRISKLAQPKSVFVKAGTVIVSLQGTIGRVAITQYDCYVDRTLAIFTDYKEDINKKYFAYQLKNKFDIEKENARGSTLKTITKEEFSKFEIPIPSLPEQERIVAILDKFDTLTHSITTGLPREIELRQKQYEYYRDLLLTFPQPEGTA